MYDLGLEVVVGTSFLIALDHVFIVSSFKAELVMFVFGLVSVPKADKGMEVV